MVTSSDTLERLQTSPTQQATYGQDFSTMCSPETSRGNSSIRKKVTACKLLRKDSKGGGGIMLYTEERFEDKFKRIGHLRAFVSKSEVSPSRKCLCWVSAMDDLTGKVKQMKTSSDDFKTGNSSLGCSDKIMEFSLPRTVKNITSRIKPQNYIRADFILLRLLLEGIPEESALETKGIQEYWETLRDSLLQAHEKSIHLSRKRSWHSKKAALLNSEILRELRCKKEYERDRKGNRLPKPNIEIILGHAEMQREGIKPSWSRNWKEMRRAARKHYDIVCMLANRRTRKM